MPYDAWVTRIGPLNLEIPLAPFIVGIELHLGAIAGRKNAIGRKFVVRPVIIARIVEAKEFNAVAGTVDDRHIALVFRKR